MPGHIQQKTLVYEQREDEIALIGHAIALICHGNPTRALEVLQRYRNDLQDKQKPRVVDYDPRREAERYERLGAL